MSEAPPSLARHLLIALPSLGDPNFAGSVVLICQHDADGAMGLMINRATDLSWGELMQQMALGCDDAAVCERPVLAGGPVHGDRGFVLHEGDAQWDSSLPLGEGLSMTTSRDVLEALASGTGPVRALLTLGCTGWGPGQLERELEEPSWLTVPATAALLFDAPLEQRWQGAAATLGVDLLALADHVGHA
jgi:putative transcriptional regulator